MSSRVARFVRPTTAGLTALALCAAAVALDRIPSRVQMAERPLAFPRDYASGVLYGTADRLDLVEYRELYAPASAVAAIRAGKPLPLGTVLTMVTYAAKRNWLGTPIADERGRFVKDEMKAILVMEKHRAAPTVRPSDAADVNWRFQMFRPDSTIEHRANLSACAECHEKRWSEDYVFTRDEMRGGPPAVR